MTRGARISLALVAAFVVAAGAILLVGRANSDSHDPHTDTAGLAAEVARPDSHRISSAPAGSPTLVEFLDFECPACAGAYLAIEDLRAEYGDRVDFVVRYYPLRMHFNAERAARAVEAAAQQGKFEQMVQRVYETQTEWGNQRVPKDDYFRGLALELGLDMTAFDAAYDDPATAARIVEDVADGKALGVEGTPTFFLNGQLFQPNSIQDITDALDAALN
ncbi:DsbA family protein [Prescottella agglutinans]|uniref:Protein-disulfide isomerase n=1 Tax=Prescottella agglutinans TaxID=1644129 RepID=A0ABT6MJC0_9NOCA|nr:thioredoxin domain-containing protein [Prescottella agglutinans]MDH6284000.1 protein-disulfide isomerase [Prescottella agglutinans]